MAGPVRRQGVQSLVPPFRQRASADGMLVPADLGPAPFKPSQPEGYQDPSRRLDLPGHLYPPPDAIPLDTITPGTAIGFGASATLATILIPGTKTLRIDGIGFGAGDESGLAFLSWSLIGTPPGTPITPYNNVPAGIGSIVHPSFVFVVVGSTTVITLVATNNSLVLGTYTYTARIKGWYFTEKVAG